MMISPKVIRRRAVEVTFKNGHVLSTDINGTEAEIILHYLNQTFNLGTGGEDNLQIATGLKFID